MVSSEDRTEITMEEVGESNNSGEDKDRHKGKESKPKPLKLMKEKSAEGVTYSYSSSNLLAEEEKEEVTEEQEKKTVEVLGRILYTPPRKVRSGFSSILFSHQPNSTPFPSPNTSHHHHSHHHSHNTHHNHHSPSTPSSNQTTPLLHNSSPSIPNPNTPPNTSSNTPSHNNTPHHSSHHNTHHALPQLAVDCKLEALCKNIVTWLNSLRKMNFVIEDIAMNLLIINAPHIWVSVHRDHSTRRAYAKKEWTYKLFGKTCNVSEKNIGHGKSAKVTSDFIQWRISLPPSITVVKSLSNSPYSSFILALYQP